MISEHLYPNTSAIKFTEFHRNFADYITEMKATIKAGRIDLNCENSEEIIELNAPFEWHPKEPNGDAVILLHGLYDSPFSVRDLATHFVSKGYLVRAPLLPGHGTIAGNLLNISHQDWLDTVEYTINETSPIARNIYLFGFSLGGALSLLSTHHAPNIKAVIAFAPAIKPLHPFSHITKIHKLFTWISKKAKWYQRNEQLSTVKYFSHPYHAAHEGILVMTKSRKSIPKVPLFFVMSSEDETIQTKAVINYFKQHAGPKGHFIYYTNDDCQFDDARIVCRKSAFPEKNILDFSHSCLPVSPDNHFLGEHGTFLDFSHYLNGEHHQKKNIKLGAVTKHNLTHHVLRRLNYNPDFDYMVSKIDEFIGSL